MIRRTITIAVLSLGTVAATLTVAAPAHAAPPLPQFRPAIEGYAAYDAQDTCDPTAKPGVIDFRDLLNRAYGSHTSGIARACSEGGQSEHKEGRALDWHINANVAADRAIASDIISWLHATDVYGNRHALARRLGLMYIIWNRQIWSATSPNTWEPYTGASPHTDHMHFSFSWAGARKQTSWWTGRRQLNGDFNRDGATDFAVWRPGNGTWYVHGSGTFSWGLQGDVPVSGDYNGDGRTDVAVWRPANGTWYLLNQGNFQYGLAGDVPVPADYTGDGKTDRAVWRPSNGTWYIYGAGTFSWGLSGDIPAPADYNGDGAVDVAVFRPSNGTWYVLNQGTFQYGQAGDVPVAGDYTGDGKADRAVWRPGNGTWYVHGAGTLSWGLSGDVPVPGDYNRDGKLDRAVWRPGNGTWYVYGQRTLQYGATGDIPAV